MKKWIVDHLMMSIALYYGVDIEPLAHTANFYFHYLKTILKNKI